MKHKVKLGLIGCYGKMGKAIVAESPLHESIVLISGFPCSKNNIAKEDGINWGPNIKLCTTIEEVFECSDVVIEFTSPVMMKECIMCAIKFNKPLVSGTTGHANYSFLEQASKKIPILWSANMSYGINVLMHILQNIPKNMARDIEASIIEIHHTQKKDSPSGTAIILKQCLEGFFDKELSIHSIRLGTNTGKHSIFFSINDEMIEITHTTHNRKPFAKGAINAAKWLHNQTNGLYSTLDLLK